MSIDKISTSLSERSQIETTKTSVEINSESLTARFGPGFLKGKFKREELTPFFLPANQIIPAAETPNRASHFCTWEMRSREFENPIFSVKLEDTFSVPKSKDEEEFKTKDILEELRIVGSSMESPSSSQLPTKLRELGEQIEKQSDGWNLRLFCEPDPMDGWDFFSIDLVKPAKENNSSLVRLDLSYSYASSFKIVVPLGEDFNSLLEEARNKMKVMSDWLGLAYAPELKYQFVLPENSKLTDPVRSATSFVDYFYKCLDIWKFYPTQTRMRALIGASQDKNTPILLLEDPNLSAGVNNLGEALMSSSSARGVIVNSHPDIFRAFSNAIENRRVSEQLATIFPREDYNDQKWLHMFVEIGPDDEFVLKEDFSSNQGKEDLEPLIHLVEDQYGIGYGGKIDIKTSERLAKMPMYLPTINEQTAVIREKYGSLAASKFRGAAISGLVDGIPQAMEIYESYLKLLGRRFKLSSLRRDNDNLN